MLERTLTSTYNRGWAQCAMNLAPGESCESILPSIFFIPSCLTSVDVKILLVFQRDTQLLLDFQSNQSELSQNFLSDCLQSF